MDNRNGCFVRIIGFIMGVACIVPCSILGFHLMKHTYHLWKAIEGIVITCMLGLIPLTCFFVYNAITQLFLKGEYSFSEFWGYVIEFIISGSEE